VRRTRRLGALALSSAVLIPLAGCSSAAMPTCEAKVDVIVLVAQSVPSATELPCVAQLPAGWSYSGQEIRSGSTRFWLNSNIAGPRVVEVQLTPSCDVAGAVPVPSTAADEEGLRRFDKPEAVRPLRLTRYYRFAGGCIIYRYTFNAGAPASLQFEADEALSFLPRSDVVDAVRAFGFRLCGAGVRCPG
jgi:hypothetical protein